jgi:glycosyltransferase involved in cell wall biosynthesis
MNNLSISDSTNGHPLALVMMIKNEEKRLEVTFNSVKDICKTFIILDTGSSDRTVSICNSYCSKNNIKLFLKEEPFVNFCISRNVLLDFADKVLKKNTHYLLLLDCNDELKNVNELNNFIKTYDGPCTGFHLRQQWLTANSLDTYYNIRMVLSHNRWRYKSVVHEYICQENIDPFEESSKTEEEKMIEEKNRVCILENIVLYQDRTKDDDKSMKRFSRDKELLYAEYVKNPLEPRTIFYLAQTCSCLGQFSESYMYYYERTKVGGFYEEQFHAYYRLGELSHNLGHAWEESLNWYLKAFYHSKRVEPLLRIAEYYKDHNPLDNSKNADFATSFMYLSMACKLMYPHNQILFVNKQDYLYRRWHLMGIVAYYIGRYNEGKEACIKALQSEPNSQIDHNNLRFYLEKELEISQQILDKKLIYPTNILITSERGEHYPEKELDSGFGTKMTREDILKFACMQLMISKKNASK